jgi:hypothetical protein
MPKARNIKFGHMPTVRIPGVTQPVLYLGDAAGKLLRLMLPKHSRADVIAGLALTTTTPSTMDSKIVELTNSIPVESIDVHPNLDSTVLLELNGLPSYSLNVKAANALIRLVTRAVELAAMQPPPRTH